MSAFFSTLNPPATPQAINMILCTAYCWSERNLSFFTGRQPVMSSGLPRCWGFTITLRHTTVGRTPLDEWSARRRDLYLTTHNTHRRQTSMLQGGFSNPQYQQASGRRSTPYTKPLVIGRYITINSSVLQKYSLNFGNVMCSLPKILWCEFHRN
jgi:hypothetical protein